MGHFATALLPYSKLRGTPAWLLLLCAQFGDWTWLLLALANVEAPTPTNFLDVSIVGLEAAMPYSHTGLGTLVQTVAVAAVVQAVWKNKALSLWCGGLVFLHWVQDLVSGWPHEVFTVDTPKIGFGFYETNPYLAFGIEVVFSLGCCLWFVKSEAAFGRPLSQRNKLILFAVFVGGSTMFIPTATHSFRTLLGL